MPTLRWPEYAGYAAAQQASVVAGLCRLRRGRFMPVGDTVQRFLRWDEVTSVEWGEGRQTHDLRQLLQLTLRQPLIRHRHRFQLTVSEGKNAERCSALMALLPALTTRPAWMPRVQQLQNTRYVTD